MTELDRLRAENIALREEIAEWRRQAAEAEGVAQDEWRADLLRQRFGLTLCRAMVLDQLLTRAPHVFRREAIMAARGRRGRVDDPSEKGADVLICYLRAGLGPELRGVLRTNRSRGWWISREDAARVLAAAGAA